MNQRGRAEGSEREWFLGMVPEPRFGYVFVYCSSLCTLPHCFGLLGSLGPIIFSSEISVQKLLQYRMDLDTYFSLMFHSCFMFAVPQDPPTEPPGTTPQNQRKWHGQIVLRGFWGGSPGTVHPKGGTPQM